MKSQYFLRHVLIIVACKGKYGYVSLAVPGELLRGGYYYLCLKIPLFVFPVANHTCPTGVRPSSGRRGASGISAVLALGVRLLSSSHNFVVLRGGREALSLCPIGTGRRCQRGLCSLRPHASHTSGICFLQGI